MTSNLDGAVSPKTAAELYDVSIDVIRAAYRSGLLPVRYVGASVRISRADLKAWFDALPTERVSA
jgi:excisionase family DNA binding protein